MVTSSVTDVEWVNKLLVESVPATVMVSVPAELVTDVLTVIVVEAVPLASETLADPNEAVTFVAVPVTPADRLTVPL